MMRRLAMIAASIIAPTNSGDLVNRKGPGLSPCSMIAASITAVVALPGMPRDIIGTIAPMAAALLAVSGAAIPSGMPVPNFSGCLENLAAVA